MTSEMRSSVFVISVPFLELACSWKNATASADVGRLHPSGTLNRSPASKLINPSTFVPRTSSKKFSGNFRDARRNGGYGRGGEEVPTQLLQRGQEIVRP